MIHFFPQHCWYLYLPLGKGLSERRVQCLWWMPAALEEFHMATEHKWHHTSMEQGEPAVLTVPIC